MTSLASIALNIPARITAIDWDELNPSEVTRMQAFGFEIGAQVEALHRAGLFGRDPLAVKIGRMTIALRKAQALAVNVTPL
jgi:ferrous iron transport protein A